MADFVHLHVHSDYSLLDGAAKIESLVARAKELGMSALALTDHGNMFGAIHFEETCRKHGIKPIIGCEVYVAPGSRFEKKQTAGRPKYHHLVLLARNTTGYRNLIYLVSRGYTEGFYSRPRIDEELLQGRTEGLICLSACIVGELPRLLLAGDTAGADNFVERYGEMFGKDYFFVELQKHGLAEQEKAAPLLLDIASRHGVSAVLTNDVHYVLKEDYQLQEMMWCIAKKQVLSDPTRRKYDSKEFYLKSADEMARIFPSRPELLANTRRIAELCGSVIPVYETQDLKTCLPDYQIPAEFPNAEMFLRYLVAEGLKKRYPDITTEIRERAEYELKTIIDMGFMGYFLIVWDFIDWAKQQDIPIGPGRGSGAGSIVAYSMGITNMDPLRFGLYFERFLNPERVSMPDFDIDICRDGRQAVIEYTRGKYGDPQVGHIVTFTTLGAKGVIKDVGRVLEIPLAEVASICERVPQGVHVQLKDAFEKNQKVSGSGQLAEERGTERYKRMFDLSLKMEGMHRNTSLHASGIVIGKTELTDWVPVYKDTKSGKIATEYAMDQVERCGLVKMDYLGLRTLTIIRRTEKLIRKRPGFENFDAEKIDEHDEKTFDLFCAGQTDAAFQFESEGMKKVLRQAQPRRLEDLIALNALYRPGPMDNIDKFVESRFNAAKVTYPHPSLKGILEETYGVIVYQEQVMKAAQILAGYTLGGADILRRAMGKKKVAEMAKQRAIFVAGCAQNHGIGETMANELFDLLDKFAGYGFNKSHSAAYALVAYRTMYLKAHFPAEFIAANLTNETTGSDDKLADYIHEAQDMGIIVDPPNVNSSHVVFDVMDGRIVFGLMGIKGLGQGAAEEIVAKRGAGGYTSFLNFLEQVDLHTINKRALEVLIKTGAFDSLGQTRPELLQNMERAVDYADHKKTELQSGQTSLFGEVGEKEFADFAFEKADDWPGAEKLAAEKEFIGCAVSEQPVGSGSAMDKYRTVFRGAVTLTADQIHDAWQKTTVPVSQTWAERQAAEKNKKRYIVAGILKDLRVITIKNGKNTGRLMAFAKLEDFTGTMELVFFSSLWERKGPELRENAVAAFRGTIGSTKDGTGSSFQVEDVLDPDSLEQKTLKEVHIELRPFFSDDTDLYSLRESLFNAQGDCEIYFHFPQEKERRVIRAHTGLRIPGSPEFIAELSRSCPLVGNVWTA